MRKLRKSLPLIAAALLASSAALADPPAKKPLYPPPEQSNTVGVFGAHHSERPAAGKDSSQPPAPVAAPETYKVETEQPSSLPAAPHDYVQSEQPAVSGSGPAIAPLPVTPPTGFLPDHPVVSGLVAGLIGSDLGSELYGGAMVGDRTAATIGYALRVGLILALALALFRFIGRRASAGSDDRLNVPKMRRDPSFGKAEPMVDGRREPHFTRGE